MLCSLVPIVVTLGLSGAIAQTGDLGWRATVRVVDEWARPVSNANVAVWYYVQPSAGETEAHASIQGVTDANGTFTASNPTNGSIDLGFQASKSGYYSTTRGHEFAKFKNSDPGKRNPQETLLLKTVGKPIPMYAKSITAEPSAFKKTGPPPIAFTNSIGYDLKAGDWVSPYGKGANTDIIFTEEFNKKAISDYDYRLLISFPSIGDGIQEFKEPQAEKGSALRSPHEVPEDGYLPQLTRESSTHPGQPGKSDYDVNRIYFFRVRTVLDANGIVKSALYGKIYGDPVMMNFRYYLNPTPNDRNIEFDPNHNLLRDLKSFELVRQP